MLEWVRNGQTEIRPIFIDDYLNRFGAHGHVRLRTGAWNTGWHHGVGFKQWTGSDAQKEALRRVAETSRVCHAARAAALKKGEQNPEFWRRLEQAQWRLLRSETSCNFFWGEDWVNRCHQDLDAAWETLRELPR
jgi:hypothetical protein